MSAATSAPSRSHPRLTFPYLDGIRGLASLYVLLHHVYLEMDTYGLGKGLPHKVAFALQPLTFGNVAVDVFIVLSGYCLSLPVARQRELRGGLGDFFRRRARRILPAYYAALLLFWGMEAALPVMRRLAGVRWDAALPAFGAGNIAAHLLLLHDLSPLYLYKIDPPMWSIAVEFQIYVVFALLLVPVWRRFGAAATVALAVILSLLPHLLLAPSSNFDWACPWFLGLFACGLFAARYAASPPPALHRLARFCAIVTALVAAATLLPGRQWWLDHLILSDFAVGAATAAFLAYATASSQDNSTVRPPLLVRLLNARLPQFLGRISYSLYLVHFPLLSLLHVGLRRVLGNSTLENALCLLCLFAFGVPLSIAVSYLFHRVFEHPFLRSRGPTLAA